MAFEIIKLTYLLTPFTPQPQSITALWLVLISRPAEGRRLSWHGLVKYCGGLSISVLNGPEVEELRWYAQRRYRYAMPASVLADGS